MTKSEFLLSVPDIIHHKSWGYAELQIVADKKDLKGACYRDKENGSSGANFGKTWLEVCQKLTIYLENDGYIAKSN